MITVQCDFDDTITVGNVSTAVREAFGPSDWSSMEEDYIAGKYSVEESNIRQFALVNANERDIERLVMTRVIIRPGFAGFVQYCHANGIRFVVASSGLDLYIGPAMKRLGLEDLEVYSATCQVAEDGITVSYSDPTGGPLTRGFKESYLRHFKKSGETIIYIGDGLSDIVPATEADYVIARDTLERHLLESGLPHFRFETFDDVARHVEVIRRQLLE